MRSEDLLTCLYEEVNRFYELCTGFPLVVKVPEYLTLKATATSQNGKVKIPGRIAYLLPDRCCLLPLRKTELNAEDCSGWSLIFHCHDFELPSEICKKNAEMLYFKMKFLPCEDLRRKWLTFFISVALLSDLTSTSWQSLWQKGNRALRGFLHDLNNRILSLNLVFEKLSLVQGIPESLRRDLSLVERALSDFIESVLTFLNLRLFSSALETLLEENPFSENPDKSPLSEIIEKSKETFQAHPCGTACVIVDLKENARGHRVPSSFMDVFLNLFINAAEAGATRIVVKAEIEDRDLIIWVKDNGSGIPREIIPFVFVPSFSSKEGKTERGMGLYSVYRTVRSAGGRVFLESEENRGTTFKMVIPLPGSDNSASSGLMREPHLG